MNLKDMNDKDFVIEVAKRIIPIVSISPESGGEGESKRADEIIKILKELGYSNFQRYDTKDKKGYVRSSIILKVGNAKKTLWLISHIDTVPVGDLSLWKHDPFKVTVEGDRMYGRGTEDDGQAVFTSLLILKNLKPDKLKYNIGLAFVADEEMGSEYGIQYVITKDIFKNDDLIIVPDAGSEDGLTVEISEKSILWMKFTVVGKQSHASTPDEGINTLRESSRFILMLDEKLHSKYTLENNLYRPQKSTFEPTKHEKNVDNVNTIPGLEVFYLDSRVLPEYSLDNVIKDIDDAINSYEASSRATIKYEIVQKEQSPMPTDVNSEVVRKLLSSIKKIKGKDAHTIGIGGGTCAAFFRSRGIPAVVWCTTIEENAHKPDEFCLITHILGDLKIIEDMIYN